jgi:hypothetical protein
MPESQDDDDTGYFPLVMTRKAKGRGLPGSSPPLLNSTENGVNGS